MLTHQFEKAKNLQQHIVHAPSTSGFPSPLFSRLLWTHHDPRSLHTWLGARFFSVGHLVKTLLDSRTRLVKSTGAEWWQSCDRYCETLKSHLNSGSFFLKFNFIPHKIFSRISYAVAHFLLSISSIPLSPISGDRPLSESHSFSRNPIDFRAS